MLRALVVAHLSFVVDGDRPEAASSLKPEQIKLCSYPNLESAQERSLQSMEDVEDRAKLRRSVKLKSILGNYSSGPRVKVNKGENKQA